MARCALHAIPRAILYPGIRKKRRCRNNKPVNIYATFQNLAPKTCLICIAFKADRVDIALDLNCNFKFS